MPELQGRVAEERYDDEHKQDYEYLAQIIHDQGVS